MFLPRPEDGCKQPVRPPGDMGSILSIGLGGDSSPGFQMITFRHLFHGTSSVCKPSIQQNGLLPSDGSIYLSTHPFVALLEAKRTVGGENNLRGGYKQGVGGSPLIVLVERSAATSLSMDIDGYYDQHDRSGYRPSEIQFAFSTADPIHPGSLLFIERDLERECEQLLKEIERMASRLTFGFAVKVDCDKGRVYRA